MMLGQFEDQKSTFHYYMYERVCTRVCIYMHTRAQTLTFFTQPLTPSSLVFD